MLKLSIVIKCFANSVSNMLFVRFQTVFIAYIKQIIYNLFVLTASTSLAGDQGMTLS